MSMNRNAEDIYRKVVSQVSPTHVEWTEVPVNVMTDGCLIEEYAKVEYQAIVNKLALSGGIVRVSEEEFINFCKTLVYARICWVNGTKFMHPNTPGILVPAFLSLVIQNIGRASNIALGLALTPVVPEFTPMSVTEIQKISAFLKSIPGYEGATALPKDKEGCFEFMSMQLIGTAIRTYTPETHPVYALMASIIGPHYIESVLNPRVYYGDINLYRGMLWQITSV